MQSYKNKRRLRGKNGFLGTDWGGDVDDGGGWKDLERLGGGWWMGRDSGLVRGGKVVRWIVPYESSNLDQQEKTRLVQASEKRSRRTRWTGQSEEESGRKGKGTWSECWEVGRGFLD